MRFSLAAAAVALFIGTSFAEPIPATTTAFVCPGSPNCPVYTLPVGTGTPARPVNTSSPATPYSPPAFTGAASSIGGSMAVAGLGAMVAVFLV